MKLVLRLLGQFLGNWTYTTFGKVPVKKFGSYRPRMSELPDQFRGIHKLTEIYALHHVRHISKRNS